jgi:hypothetical protein
MLLVVNPRSMQVIGRKTPDTLQDLRVSLAEPTGIHQAPNSDARRANAGASTANTRRFLNPALF